MRSSYNGNGNSVNGGNVLPIWLNDEYREVWIEAHAIICEVMP